MAWRRKGRLKELLRAVLESPAVGANGYCAGRKRPSSIDPGRKSDARSLSRLSGLAKSKRASMTRLSVLSREVTSSNLRNDFFVIWSSTMRLAGATTGALALPSTYARDQF
jgi:hypothetical protein